MATRRNFLQTAGFFSAGVGLGFMPILKCSTAGNRRLKEIGLQTFTIRTELEKDWRKALVRVAEIGYKNLEMGGPLGGLSVKEFLAFLKETGLTVLSGGTSMSGFAESADRIIEESLEMGKKYLICFWPWTDSAEGKTLDDWKAMAESLNRIGEKAKKAGLSFGYHNHDLEFQVTEGKIPFDTVLEYTDPDLVFIEIDLYWIEKGNQKPIPYFEKYPGRFPLWHVKDMDNTPERFFACVGEGIMDFPAIFAKANVAGMKHVIVEHDRPEFPMDCIRQSFDYLNSLRF